MKVKLEYVWLDGYKPEPNLRSKVKIIDDGLDKIDFTIPDYPDSDEVISNYNEYVEI